MTDFGDYEPDDAYDTAAADPLQVAIKIQRLQRDLGIEGGTWDSLEPQDRNLRIEVASRLLAWLRRQGAN